MVSKKWHEAFANALQKEGKPVMQLATMEASNRPRVRTLGVEREFITASALPTLPLTLSMTDVRTPKVVQLTRNAVVEAVIWAPSTQEQFRILGRASIVPAVEHSGPYPERRGVVYEALDREGFDWESKRVETFNQMTGRTRAALCRPVPGTPLEDEEEKKKWPRTLPKLSEAKSEEERRDVATALSNFALLLIEPFEVDYIERLEPYGRRTRFERDWDEQSVEFKETLVF